MYNTFKTLFSDEEQLNLKKTPNISTILRLYFSELMLN